MTPLRTPLEHCAAIFLAFFFASSLIAADCPQQDLFAILRATAASDPVQAFHCAAGLKSETQRDFVLRMAFLAAAPSRPELAVENWSALAGKPWLTTLGFFPVLDIARRLPLAQAKTLMLNAARRNPSLALRDYESYTAFPFAAEIFKQAVLSAPDEAVSLAAKIPATLARLQQQNFPVLSKLAADSSLSASERERLAVFHRQIETGALSEAAARRLIVDEAFFPALVRLRLNQTGDTEFLDRLLARTAALTFRWFEDRPPRLAHLNATELYLLLSYGRAEEDDRLFAAIFDRLLLPKLRGAPLPDLQLRHFLALSAEHARLDAFLRAAPAGILGRSMSGIDSLDDALDASEVIEAISQPPQLAQLRTAIEAQPQSAFYGLLLARIAEKTKTPGSVYARFLQDGHSLDTRTLFDSSGRCIERHVFHADDDGVESFESFQRQYASDTAWHWEDQGDWVRLSAGHVIIYANKPTGNGQAAISRELAAVGAEPTMFVHRGHSYHVERSLPYLTGAARLVFLGSCRGLGVTAEVLLIAPNAQLISTRSVGTASVNDPLLKAINDELRKGVATIDWRAFWTTQRSRFGRSPVFEDYIPPFLNPGARFAAAYYAWLAS